MKKTLCVLFVAMLLVGLLNVTAMADDRTDYKFSFRAGTTMGTSADFGYATNYKKKEGPVNYIEVRHTVPESAAGYTNLIAARREDTGKYVGSKWMKSNGIYYSTNGGCVSGKYYTPCGRGNTNYYENDGITSITITGQFRVH